MNWTRQKWWDIASEIGEQKVDFCVLPPSLLLMKPAAMLELPYGETQMAGNQGRPLANSQWRRTEALNPTAMSDQILPTTSWLNLEKDQPPSQASTQKWSELLLMH